MFLFSLSTVVLKLEVKKNLFKMLFCFDFCDFNLIRNAEVNNYSMIFTIITVCLKTIFEASISFPWQRVTIGIYLYFLQLCILYEY